MSEHDDQTQSQPTEAASPSVGNPFTDPDAPIEKPQLQLSKKRAAAMGTAFGLILVLLALVCVLLSFALSSCTG